jgi:hypothetical protein
MGRIGNEVSFVATVPCAAAARLKGHIARNPVTTRLGPVDWEVDSNEGFDLASGAWRGRDFVGGIRFESCTASPGSFCLRDKDLSARREVWAEWLRSCRIDLS